jgi:hypothetical protein
MPRPLDRAGFHRRDLGMTLTVLTGIYSLRTLCTLVPLERFPKPAQTMILFFRLAPPNTNG